MVFIYPSFPDSKSRKWTKPAEKVMMVRAGLVYNSEKNLFEKDQEILIVGGKIADIGPEVSAPSNTKIIDMSKHTVTPGLVDAHTHLLLSIPYSADRDPNRN